jgi:hypothetical protein
MKDISFKRKLKHLKKDFQRRNILFLDRINEIKKFFFQYGAYCANENNLERILKFENNDSRRFKKLLIRLGKAAKKKNSLVRVIDIINIISDESCCYVFENYECVKISDPREIIFYKYYKIKKTHLHLNRSLYNESMQIQFYQLSMFLLCRHHFLIKYVLIW